MHVWLSTLLPELYSQLALATCYYNKIYLVNINTSRVLKQSNLQSSDGHQRIIKSTLDSMVHDRLSTMHFSCIVVAQESNILVFVMLLLLLQASRERYAFFPSMIKANRLRINGQGCTV